MSERDVQAEIKELVTSNPVVLFMKGSPDFPQCGFSMRASQIVRALGLPFQAVDVLQDPQVRQGIKDYGNWPTIPQLYMGGELIGGSDIMMELWESGELQERAKALGPTS